MTTKIPHFRGKVLLLVGALSIGVLTNAGLADGPPQQDGMPYRAFASTSWWNTPIPRDAPQHQDETAVLDYLRTAEDNGGGYLRLAGAGDNDWGQPVYWAGAGDQEYDVQWDDARRAPELDHLRIPKNTRAAPTSDGALTLFDIERGYVVAMTRAVYTTATDTWSVDGATVTYLASSGLDRRVSKASDQRNRGSHRGNTGATMMARLDEVRAGRIDHVIKISVGPSTNVRNVFPMVGSDGKSTTSPLLQGMRIRIRPEVDLAALGLQPEAMVIAQAAQRYGVYFGDSGGNTTLKLENTRAEGRGQLWNVSADALAGLPFTDQFWDVLTEGYDPTS